MTRKLIAFLMAMLLVLSVLLLAGCSKDKDDEDDDDDDDKTESVESTNSDESAADESSEAEMLSAKELFELSVKQTVEDVQTEIPEILTNTSDISASMEIDLDKLEIEGQDVLNGETVAVGLGMGIDVDNELFALDAFVELLGEKPTVGTLVNKDAVYITDFLGVNDKAISVSMADLMAETGNEFSMDELTAAMEELQAQQDLLNAFTEAFITAISDALEANLTDDVFTKETRTAIVNNVTFEDATLVSLTVDKELAQVIVRDVLNALKDNEAFLELMGEEELNVDEAVSEIGEFGSFIITTTLSAEGDTVAYNIAYKGIVESYPGFGANIYTIKDDFRFEIGPLDESGLFDYDEGVIIIDYVLDDNGGEALVIGLKDGAEQQNVFNYSGTYINGKREGTLVINSENNDTVSISFSSEGNIEKGNFAISNIEVTQSGETISLPINLSVEYDITDTEAKLAMDLAMAMDGMFDIEASIEYAISVEDINLSVPTDAVDVNSISESDAMEWIMELTEKYPNIFQFISEMAM